MIRFAPPEPDEPPGPPAPPRPATVVCGQTLTESTLVTNDLFECPGDALVIGAPRIVVDLGGHTIDGVGLGSGVRNDGYASVTVQNGTLQEFDYGVHLRPDTNLNLVQRLTLRRNEVGAVELFDVAASEVRDNVLDENGGGILLVSGTADAVVAGNTITANGKAGLLVRDADGNRLEDNSVSGGGDLGIGLERATGNALVGNTVAENSDGGIELRAGSHGNRIERNTVTASGDHGIFVDESDRNELVANTTHFMSDSGITLETANDGLVRGNDVRFNTGGLQIDGSSRNAIEANDASETNGIGIELGGGSLENTVADNVASENGSVGIYVGDDAADPLGVPIPGLGNSLLGNLADGNRADGIVVAKGGHTLRANVARDNAGTGINAALNTIDGGLNVATGNLKPEQCVGVICKAEWNAPETTITGAPPEATTGRSASFAFAGDDDTTAASALRFECRLDPGPGAIWESCSSPRAYTGLAEGNHVFEVRAIDLLDNVDPSPATHVWAVDATPPETRIESGPDAETASTTASFTFSASEPSATFWCSLDGGTFETCASPIVYSELAEGAHEFRVVATDAAGNGDPTPANHRWIVDVTPPETTLDSAPSKLTTSTSATFAFSSADAEAFECSLDGAAFEPCESPVAYANLADGEHTFEVRAGDRVGNVDATPAGHEWIVDTTPPETEILSGPSDPSNDSSPSFAFGSEEGAGFECRLNGGDWLPCANTQHLDGLADGPHTLEVRAVDAAGNVDDSPASSSWTLDTFAPETSVVSGPAAVTSNTKAAFAFEADEEALFECSLDGAEFAACESPQEHSALTDGEHVFAVRAVDEAGNVDASPALFTWRVDTLAPETSIDSGPDALTSSIDASFAFSAGEPASFECSLDGAPYAPCSSPHEYVRLADGEHSFEVRAIDKAGNVDASPASFGWRVDTVAPETSITSGPGEVTSSTSASIAFTSDEPASFECSLDGAAFDVCVSPQEYVSLADGEHTFNVRAVDKAGNVDASPASLAWRVDTVAPETAIAAAPADASASAAALFAFSANESASFECSLDSAPFAACSSPLLLVGLADGEHELEVRAIDEAANVDVSPASHGWRVDTAAPETSIDSGPPASTNDSVATLTFSSEAEAQFECSLDGAAFGGCSSPQAYVGLADGGHRFEVRAVDEAGNVDASPASFGWRVDTAAPDTVIDSGPPASTSDAAATFTFSSEPGGVFECSLDGAAFAACASPREYAGLARGAHLFQVRATDADGNTDASPATYAWTVVLPPDVTPPETMIDSGPPAETASTEASFEFSANEAGSSFECALDSAAFAACVPPAELANLSLGGHSFAVRATDPAGNTDESHASYAWTVVPPPDVTPPETLIASGPPAETASTEASFAFSANEAGSTFECSLDGAAFSACSSPTTVAGLALGEHRFEVRATDAAGNTDASPAVRQWSIVPPPDVTAPETTIDSAPDASTTSTFAVFAFSASEPGARFECALDGAAFTACGSPATVTGLALGAHRFEVRATDLAGNVDASPAFYVWTVVAPPDVTAPVTTISLAPPPQTTSTSASFTFSANEPGATFQCSLDGAPFTACVSPQSYQGLVLGQHRFEGPRDRCSREHGREPSRSYVANRRRGALMPEHHPRCERGQLD